MLRQGPFQFAEYDYVDHPDAYPQGDLRLKAALPHGSFTLTFAVIYRALFPLRFAIK